MPTVTTVRTDLRRGINSGAAFKIPCKVATTAAITLFGEQTIDGVACVAYDSVLVKNQADGTFNGIYWVATGAWTRRPDFDGYFDARHGTLVWVNQGSTNALTLWRVSTADISSSQGPLPDTTSIAFTEVELGGGAAPAADVVGFSAVLTADQTSGTTIVFDSVSGLGCFDTDTLYNTSTGVFTPNATGLWAPFATVYVTNSGGEASPSSVEIEMRSGSNAIDYDANILTPDIGTFHLAPGPVLLSSGASVTVLRSGASWSSNVRAKGQLGSAGRVTRFGAYYLGSA